MMVKQQQRAKPTARTLQKRPVWMWSLLLAGWAMCVAALGGWVADYTSDPANLPLKVIRINGDLVHLQRDRLQRVVAEAIEGGFFGVDMAKVRSAVKALPWVDQVSVRRVYPHTLEMDVTEQVAIARWGSDQLVNARGEVFLPDGVAVDGDLLQLSGPEGSSVRVVAFCRELQARLAKAGLELTRLSLEQRRDWQLETRDGMTLVLAGHDVSAQLNRFLLAYPVLAADPVRRVERVDMRYGHGFAVRWQDRELSGKGEQETGKRGNA